LHFLAVLVEAGQEESFLSQTAARTRDDVGHDFLVGVAEMRLAVDVINCCGDVKPFAHCRIANVTDKWGKGNLACSVYASCYDALRLSRKTSRQTNTA
jgi:hypothetical protein